MLEPPRDAADGGRTGRGPGGPPAVRARGSRTAAAATAAGDDGGAAGGGAPALRMSTASLGRVLRTLTRLCIERCREASRAALAAPDSAAARRALRPLSST